MGAKTKIDWCDATWNPVTGCMHDCKYCYARGIARRFGLHMTNYRHTGVFDLDKPMYQRALPGRSRRYIVYPFDFEPTFHRYRLDEPKHWKKPRTVFVCSMADLFGEWVPDEWIEAVFMACEAAPQHRYLFLTKNPKRYGELLRKGIVLPNTIDWMYGFTMDGSSRLPDRHPLGYRVFCSIEPILNKPDELLDIIELTDWCIVGAETGNRQGKVVPERSWIESIVQRCRGKNIPVFMKESLRELMGSDFTQETPWDVRK